MEKETLKKIFNFLEKEENRKKPFTYKLTFNEPLTEKDLNIERGLNLSNSKITSIPKDLKVGGNLYIYRTKFTEISDDELVNMIMPNGYIKGEIIGNI